MENPVQQLKASSMESEVHINDHGKSRGTYYELPKLQLDQDTEQ